MQGVRPKDTITNDKTTIRIFATRAQFISLISPHSIGVRTLQYQSDDKLSSHRMLVITECNFLCSKDSKYPRLLKNWASEPRNSSCQKKNGRKILSYPFSLKTFQTVNSLKSTEKHTLSVMSIFEQPRPSWMRANVLSRSFYFDGFQFSIQRNPELWRCSLTKILDNLR